VHGRTATPFIGMIHDIIMDQREIMENLDGESCGQRIFVLGAEDSAGREEQYRAKTLSAAPKYIPNGIVQTGRFSLQNEFAEMLVDPVPEHLDFVPCAKFI
jgi:hypothetical protein